MSTHPTPSLGENDDLDPAALDRFWSGEASAEERAAVTAWLDTRPELRTWHAQLHDGIVTDGWRDLSQQDVEARIAATFRQAGIGHPATASVSRPTASGRAGWMPARGFMGRYATVGIAAAAVLGAGFGVVKFLESTNQSPRTVRTYATRSGQRATVVLATGDKALLGPATTIEVSVGGRTGTEVVVQGEALFTVAHHGTAPFVVRTQRAVAQVLGTTFLVRQYATDRTARVFVSEGRVGVSARTSPSSPNAQHVVLSARALGTIDDSGRVIVTPNVGPDQMTSLTGGRLVFSGTSMRDVIPELNRSYDVEIQIADTTLLRKTVTLVVPVETQSLESVLDALTITLDAHIARAGRVITIVPGRKVKRSIDLNDHQEKQYGR